jgi:2-polyprenyl-3-methyl-5-hydroxy-6-metoxy-1,4-benzoquinol methylase
MVTSPPVDPSTVARRDALVDRIFQASLGAFDLAAIYLGERLGLYRSLDAEGAMTAGELAAASGINERFAREWLEQQAVTGFLDVDDPAADADLRRYRLPDAHAEVLLNPESLHNMASLTRGLVASMLMLPLLLEAYQTGQGIPWERYGADMREAQADGNRPVFLALMGTEWLPSIPDLDARLRAEPPARVADIACGAGWSSIAIARAYPLVRVDGIDFDHESIAMARRHADQAGLADRVFFSATDAADPELRGSFDLVTIFEALHDMARPVEVLRAIRDLLAPGGSILVADERVADTFTAPGDEVERFMYGWSILNCLATGMAEQPSAATGTVLRPATLKRYVEEAGYSRFEVLPIEHDTFRFYRLRP